ncbi:hypothetical protein SCHPADRAFT_896792 [Schizopora paradoxa]|uniref:Uncharacterized protein n=1 Tax=Schizopora paradoxa TaxID=27342 RepID=A0A0H2R0H2_9AGAM|nr:hypothetical protein SCHPADRAFT_896792 [Schizopora paradoxa]
MTYNLHSFEVTPYESTIIFVQDALPAGRVVELARQRETFVMKPFDLSTEHLDSKFEYWATGLVSVQAMRVRAEGLRKDPKPSDSPRLSCPTPHGNRNTFKDIKFLSQPSANVPCWMSYEMSGHDLLDAGYVRVRGAGVYSQIAKFTVRSAVTSGYQVASSSPRSTVVSLEHCTGLRTLRIPVTDALAIGSGPTTIHLDNTHFTITMYDINSQERQAHHMFMTMSAFEYRQINNHELLGLAAAYHAACKFTDWVHINNRLPQTHVHAQNKIISYARSFIKEQIQTKNLNLDLGRAEQFALASLYKRIYNPNPAAWRVEHMTLARAFENWREPEEQEVPEPQRWAADEYNYGRFGSDNYSNLRSPFRTPPVNPLPLPPQSITVMPAAVNPKPPSDSPPPPPPPPPPSGGCNPSPFGNVDPKDFKQILDVFARLYWRP